MASKDEVRGLARRLGNGGSLNRHEQATLDRSTSQAGAEGRKLTRLAGGSKEKD